MLLEWPLSLFLGLHIELEEVNKFRRPCRSTSAEEDHGTKRHIPHLPQYSDDTMQLPAKPRSSEASFEFSGRNINSISSEAYVEASRRIHILELGDLGDSRQMVAVTAGYSSNFRPNSPTPADEGTSCIAPDDISACDKSSHLDRSPRCTRECKKSSETTATYQHMARLDMPSTPVIYSASRPRLSLSSSPNQSPSSPCSPVSPYHASSPVPMCYPQPPCANSRFPCRCCSYPDPYFHRRFNYYHRSSYPQSPAESLHMSLRYSPGYEPQQWGQSTNTARSEIPKNRKEASASLQIHIPKDIVEKAVPVFSDADAINEKEPARKAFEKEAKKKELVRILPKRNETMTEDSKSSNIKDDGEIMEEDVNGNSVEAGNGEGPRLRNFGLKARKFTCKYCGKIYISLGALKMHIRTHTLPCKCNICGKAFSRPWLLQGHIRTHTGEKPYQCTLCQRAFADRSNLRAHLQTHSDVKKYSCQTCRKTFSRMSLLAKHEEAGCVLSSSA